MTDSMYALTDCMSDWLYALGSSTIVLLVVMVVRSD